jgi:hypothetical protein
MATDLIQQVQQNLDYPPLHKIDPNTERIKTDDRESRPDRFSQATIPATLTALCMYGDSDQGAEAVLHADLSNNWSKVLFADVKEDVVRRIASYSGYSLAEVTDSINQVADESIRLIRERVTENGTKTDVQDLLRGIRNEVLTFLPADLRVGVLLNDPALDDKTHKMEGPVSNLMHKISTIFTGPAEKEENSPSN